MTARTTQTDKPRTDDLKVLLRVAQESVEYGESTRFGDVCALMDSVQERLDAARDAGQPTDEIQKLMVGALGLKGHFYATEMPPDNGFAVDYYRKAAELAHSLGLMEYWAARTMDWTRIQMLMEMGSGRDADREEAFDRCSEAVTYFEKNPSKNAVEQTRYGFAIVAMGIYLYWNGQRLLGQRKIKYGKRFLVLMHSRRQFWRHMVIKHKGAGQLRRANFIHTWAHTNLNSVWSLDL